MTDTMTPEQTDAVTAELRRLTLGGRGPARPELATTAGRLFAAVVEDAARNVAAAMSGLAAAVRAAACAPVVAMPPSDAQRLARATVTTRDHLFTPGHTAGLFAGIPIRLDDTLPPGTFTIEQGRP